MSVFGTYVWAFLLLLGVLVFFHELGHFLAAKLFGVRVERFSLGFGAALVQRRLGETEYRIAWLPLGGYVKMLGEVPGEELPAGELARSFGAQSVPRRIAIALAGPTMNLLLPVVVLAGMAMSGIPKPTSLIGAVAPETPAARAGIQPGDRVVAIADREIWRWEDLQRAVSESDGTPIPLVLERGEERLTVEVAPEPRSEGPGYALGVEHQRIAPQLGLPDPQGLAARTGLRTGDRVVAVGGEGVEDWYGFLTALERTSGPLELEIERTLGTDRERIRVTLDSPGPWSLERLGAVPVDFVIAQVLPGSPAKKAGLRSGDLILRVEGEPVRSFAELAERIRTGGGAPLSVGVLREGEELELEVVPRATPVEVGDKVETTWRIGVIGGPPYEVGEVREERVRNPLRAFAMGVRETSVLFVRTLDGVWKLISGRVGMDNLAGPIGIGKFAGDYFMEEGWAPFLRLLSLISVNLAILNLLPIPVLDGGQIVLTLAEVVRGGPLSLRAREIAQTGGLALILILMGFAFWNDIVRHWEDFVGFFQGLL
ncbi:MAG: RIP metalloprotease RseP [Myxococcota bacterium]